MAQPASNRRLIARIASNRRWGQLCPDDRRAATAKMRFARDARFRQEVTEAAAEAGVELTPEEFSARVVQLRRAHMLQLARRSAQVRAERKAATTA